MSAVATFDPSRKLTLYMRVGMDGSKTFNFSNAAGADYDISALTFQMLIYERVGGSVYLTWDSQLTKPTNYSMKVTYTDTESGAIRPATYFYIIKRTDGSGLIKTWFNGPLIAHLGEFDGVTSTEDFVINDAGESISVSITDSPSSGTSIQFQEEGVDLGNNQADTVDFVGAGVTATRVGDTVTVTIPGTHFLGIFISLAALQLAYPTASAGDYADVDPGGGTDSIRYHYDLQDGWIEGGAAGSVQSVTGDGVDNTDPINPVIDLTTSRTVIGADSIVQTDSLKTIYFNSGSPFNFTIDQLTVNSETAFINIGAGIVTFVAGAGVTISGVTSLPGSENATAVILYRTATNPVIVSGGGSGVETVTGDGVNNTDPDNPVLSFPTPTEIGLGNVDNTSDANKPISNAQAAEFTRIENLIGKSDLGSAM